MNTPYQVNLSLLSSKDRRLWRSAKPWFARVVMLSALPLASVGGQGILGGAQPFAVLGGSTVTNTGPTTILGNLGLYPGTSVTGQGSITLTGAYEINNAVALQAKTDARTAFTALAGQGGFTTLSGTLGDALLTPGVYRFTSDALLTGNLVLNFLGNPNSQFVFQVGSALTTASSSTITASNGNPNSGVFWQIGSSATLGTSSTFLGNIIAEESITLTTSARILCGRAIALTGAVTMDGNTISSNCGVANSSDFGSAGFAGGRVAVVPEPSTFVLMLAGGMGVAAFARRRASRSHRTMK